MNAPEFIAATPEMLRDVSEIQLAFHAFDWDVSSETLRRTVPRLRVCHNLQTLRIRDPALLHALDYVGDLGTLKCLDLSGSGIEADNLRRLAAEPWVARLESLSIMGKHLTDSDLDCLGSFSSLRYLDLFDTGLSDVGCQHLTKLLWLEVLVLRSTRVRGPGLEHLAALKKLKHLNLVETAANSDSLVQLAFLKQLIGLYLCDTAVDSRVLPTIAELTDLEELHLDHTRIVFGEAELDQLRPLQKLKELWINSKDKLHLERIRSEYGWSHLKWIGGSLRLHS